ncbi:unannotated protein [freshwater metagenome]|uniref:Unannotated protein n=1 Tax=freshwater metagenome TaxID=449393 RepID=A0A6J7NXI7_9ZZZZ
MIPSGVGLPRGGHLRDRQQRHDHEDDVRPQSGTGHGESDSAEHHCDGDDEHDPSRPLWGEVRDELFEDRAAVEWQDRDQVEQSDGRPGPQHGDRHIVADLRPSPTTVGPDVGERSDRDLRRRSGERDARPLPARERSGGSERRIAGHEVEGDLRLGARGPCGEGMAEFVQQGEQRDERSQPNTACSRIHQDDQDEQDQEP